MESVKDGIEARDEGVKERKNFFLPPVEPEGEAADMNELKRVTFDLLDIGKYYGEKGVEQIRSLPLYQKVDKAVDIDDKFEMVCDTGL